MPSTSARNFTPSSIALVSGSVPAGVAVPGQIVQGQGVAGVPTVTEVVAAAPRCWRCRRRPGPAAVSAPADAGVKV